MSEHDAVIRAMHPSDWPDVERIYRQAVADGNSTFQTESPSFEEWDAAHHKVCRLTAVQDGHIVGFCALSPTSSRQAYCGVAEVSIYVAKTDRGHGIGKRLLGELCLQSEDAGFWSLYACVFSSNTVSIALHRSCGFREIGYRERIAKDRFGVWQDTVLLEKRRK